MRCGNINGRSIVVHDKLRKKKEDLRRCRTIRSKMRDASLGLGCISLEGLKEDMAIVNQ